MPSKKRAPRLDEKVQSLLHDMRNDLLAVLMINSEGDRPLSVQDRRMIMACVRKSLASADWLQVHWSSVPVVPVNGA